MTGSTTTATASSTTFTATSSPRRRRWTTRGTGPTWPGRSARKARTTRSAWPGSTSDHQIMALKFIEPDEFGRRRMRSRRSTMPWPTAAITNASSGGDPYSQALYDAIAAARDARHIFVAAAGNGNMLGVGQDNDAALLPGKLWPWTISWPWPPSTTPTPWPTPTTAPPGSTWQPGVDVLSTIRGGGYGLNSGTSMAAPHATGGRLPWCRTCTLIGRMTR